MTATGLANKFSVSVRTIYRDMKTLEQAGIPIITEEGKGYTLMEGFRLPPIMFTESEANALVTAEMLVLKSKDSSFNEQFASAIQKIKAVLTSPIKEKTQMISSRISVSPIGLQGTATDSLILIQNALTSLLVLNIIYETEKETTARCIEPFAFYFSLEENWLLIAYCRLRNDFRMFRLDKISSITVLQETFKPHRLTLTDYLAEKRKNFYNP